MPARSAKTSPRRAAGPIAVVTGTRAEFGLLQPVLEALDRRGKLEYRLIATGMHLLREFGHTIDHIRQAGYRIDATVRMQTGEDQAAVEAEAVGRGIAGIARALDRLKCGSVLVLGDRIEAFAGAVAGATSRRPVAHIHGGDRAPGDIDDSLRNAITRLADLHLAASQDARKRLLRMGEPADRIHVTGAPGLDAIRELRAFDDRYPQAARIWLRHAIGCEPGQYAVVVQHASGRSAATEARAMRAIAAAVEKVGLAGVALYPNTDPGHTGILQILKRLELQRGWRVFKSLPRNDFLRLAAHAALLIGNSSSGVIESTSLGVNAVNVGDRQAGRLKCGRSVINVSESPGAIVSGIRRALRWPRPRSGRSVYGDGRAGDRIAAILKRWSGVSARKRKHLTY